MYIRQSLLLFAVENYPNYSFFIKILPMRQILLFVLLVCSGHVFAQKMPCASDEMTALMSRKYPPGMYVKPMSVAAKTTSSVDTAWYDVPVVVHIIHDYGSEYLSDDTIRKSFANWATIMLGANADTADVIDPFKPYVGNSRIRLHLATKDPAGNPTTGITRHQSYLTTLGDEQAKFGQWPTDKYINIWFVDLSAWATAYAYNPYGAASFPWYDGVLSIAAAVDTVKIIPHELGHYFSLAHVWGAVPIGTTCSASDTVDDTPPTMGHATTYCVPSALYDTACATGYMVHYTDMMGMDSVVDYPDTVNAQNIMDYTFCPRMFTKGQAHRMRMGLTSPIASRNNLYTPANLAATGALDPVPDMAPVPDFIVEQSTGPTTPTDKRNYFLSLGNPNSFRFRNTSWRDTIDAINWLFSGGAATPSSAAPVVSNQFSVPGWVTVTLTATSNAGTGTLERQQSVYVADTTPVGGVGYMQSFASAADIANWPMLNYYNNSFRWEFFTGAGKDDNTCIRFRSYDPSALATPPRIIGTATGDYDDIFTPAFNLNGVTGDLYVNFYTTGASTLSGISTFDPLTLDTLELYASVTGGASWTRLGLMDGYELQNNGLFATEFTPGSSAPWLSKSFAVPAAFRARNTYFRFRYRPGNSGNNVYLDNFSLSGVPAGTQEALLASRNAFAILPNPGQGVFRFVFHPGTLASVPCSIRDVAGRVVYHTQLVVTPGNLAQKEVDLNALAGGIYFVTLNVDGVPVTEKLVITQ